MNIILPLSMIIAFAVSIILAPIFIPVLRRMKMGQTEREEGVKSHLKKVGTPTMGGLIFLIAASVGTFIFAGIYPKIVPVMVLMLGFGAIGFLDDYLKVVLRRSDGRSSSFSL